ncbi:MAG: GNAT family N-acetyltransferase [Sphaerochaeta sp.]|nr:GNAT family N-acetyltransferase [Sphaerochaeta sp.]
MNEDFIKKLSVEDFFVYKAAIYTLLLDNYRINLPYIHNISNFADERIRKLESYMRDGSAFVFGFVSDKELKGFVWAYKIQIEEKIMMHITEFAVSSDYQRKGVGQSLFKFLEREAQTQIGFDGFELVVSVSNEGAVNFYKNIGFEIERFVMRKTVSSTIINE